VNSQKSISGMLHSSTLGNRYTSDREVLSREL
jgi:hypothetical protein